MNNLELDKRKSIIEDNFRKMHEKLKLDIKKANKKIIQRLIKQMEKEYYNKE